MHSTMNLGGSVVSKNILEKRGRVNGVLEKRV